MFWEGSNCEYRTLLLCLKYISYRLLGRMKNWTINITKIILWEPCNGLYFISEFNRITNCRWRIISSYDGRNILFNAAYIFVVGISSFYKGGLGIDCQLRMGQLGLGLSIYRTCLRNGRTRSLHSTLQILELGMIISGVILIGLGVTGFIGRILFLFTPLVTGITFIILKRCFKRNARNYCYCFSNRWIYSGNCALHLFVIILSNFGKGFVKSYAVLIGLISGWILSYCRKSDDSSSSNAFVQLPQIFCLGTSKMEYRYGCIKFRYGMYFSFKYSGGDYSN